MSSSSDGLALAEGTRVRLQSLQNEEKRHLNGAEGRVESWDAARGRHIVVLGDGSKLAFKVENLKVMPPMSPAGMGATCVICLENGGAHFAGVPCGHQCLCKECVDRLAARGGQLQCPTCRTDVSRFMQVFIPEPATDEQAEEALKFLEQAKLGCEAAKADQAQAEEARRAADALRAEAREVLADAQTTSANAEAARAEQAEFARAACEAARAEAALEAEAELKQLREERAALVAERAAFEEKLRIAVDEAVKPWREATKGLETRTAEEDTCAREAAAISSEVDRKQAAVAAWSAEALQVTAEEKWAKNEEVNFEASAPGSSSSQPALNDCKPVAPSSSSSSAASAQKNDGDSSSSGPSTEGEQLQQQQQQQLSPQRCGSKRPREEDPDDCTAVDPQLEPWEKCQRAWIEQQSLVISLD